MARLSPARRLLKVFHPEGIPSLGATLYDAASATWAFQRTYELVAKDVLDYCSKGSLLDVGTGPGWLLVTLQRLSHKLQLTGVDISGAMVAKAQKNIARAGFGDLIVVKEGGASSLPFADGFFDGVVSTGSIHHWKDPTAGLNDVYRVLKLGGYALMYDVVSDTPASVLQAAAHELGRWKTLLFWVHGFEEPFYACKDFQLLACPTLFQEGQIRFVSVFCCLVLKK
jgi:ubiquinone/menaquinone biosynthesis C-methylase UbiE